MKNNIREKYIGAVIIPIVILLSMTALPLSALFFGEEIKLETEPYDPRDLFRGDYVALSYKINEVDIDKFPETLVEAAKKESHSFRRERYNTLCGVRKSQ